VPATDADPLTVLLRRALDLAGDASVRRWLAGLLERGESTGSGTQAGTGQAERPPPRRKRRNRKCAS
jgi:hypothetical protein